MALMGESLTKNGDRRKKSGPSFPSLFTPGNHVFVRTCNHFSREAYRYGAVATPINESAVP